MKILEGIIEDPRITVSRLAKMTRLSQIGVKYNLKKLKKEGAIARVGTQRGGYWKVLKNNALADAEAPEKQCGALMPRYTPIVKLPEHKKDRARSRS